MKQAVDTAKINECTEVGYVLDHALTNLSLLQFAHDLFFLDLFFLFEHHPAGHDDISSALI